MKIVILSRNAELYSTDSILRAGRRRGHFMRVVDHAHCDLSLQHQHLRVYYHGYPIRNVDAIIPRIGSNMTNQGSAVIRHFEMNNIFSTLNAEALLMSRNKLSAFQKLMSSKLPIPRTVFTNNPYSMEHVLSSFQKFPVIIKLLSGTHGIGVHKAEEAKQAISLLETFQRLKQRVLIQEYIGESKGSDLRLFVVNDKVVAAMKRSAMPGEFRSNLHRGASAEAITPTPEEERIAIESCRVLGLKVAGVDLLQSDRGPLVLEVNSSPGLEGIETVTKVDVATHIIEFVEQESQK